MPEPIASPPTQPRHRRLHLGLLYALLGAAVVALLGYAIRDQIRRDVSPRVPDDLGALAATLTERRELLVDRLSVLRYLALGGALPAADYLSAQVAYSRIRARHEGCIDWLLLTLHTENGIAAGALECLRTEPEVPEALSAERVAAALRTAGPGPGSPPPNPDAPHPQSENGGGAAPAPSGAGLADIIDLDRRLRDAALAQETALQQLRVQTHGPLALQIEHWRWPAAQVIAPVPIPLSNRLGAGSSADGFDDAVAAVRQVLKDPRGDDPQNYAGVTERWLNDLVAGADNAARLRKFLTNQGPAREADRIYPDPETTAAFPGLVDALRRLERAAELRIDALTANRGVTQ